MGKLARIAAGHGHDEDLRFLVGVVGKVGDAGAVGGPAHGADSVAVVSHDAEGLGGYVDEIDLGVVDLSQQSARVVSAF